MPVLRIATAGAALLLLTAGSAVAQPTSPATGKPITLLNILTIPDKTKIKPHSHRLVASTWKTHAVAAHQRPRHLAAVATSTRGTQQVELRHATVLWNTFQPKISGNSLTIGR